MKLSACHHYGVDVDQLYPWFRQPELIRSKYQALGSRQIAISRAEDGDDGFHLELSRDIPAEVPALLKSLLGSYNRVEQQEHWYSLDDGSLGCDLQLAIHGVPVTISGQLRLVDEASGCRNEIELSVSSSLPLLGAALVKFVAGDCQRAMDAEYGYLQQQLQGGGGG